MLTEVIEGFRLSPQQEHLWLLQKGAFSQTYRVQCAILIQGNLQLNTFTAALQDVVNRHEILRTTFRCLPGMTIPVQVITNHQVLLEQKHNFSDFTPQEQENKIKKIFEEIGQITFDFEQGLLLHTSLVTLSPNRHILLLSMAAMLADSATLNNFVGELSRSYSACLQGQELSDQPLQYADFSEWQNELQEADETEVGREYWQKQDLSGIFRFKLPEERNQPNQPEFQPQFITSKITSYQVAQIKAVTQKYNSSFSIFLLACWQILIWRLTPQSDIIVGTACAGRNYQELEKALGLFARYLPLHCHFEDNFSFRQVLQQIDEYVGSISKWQDCFNWQENLEEADKYNKKLHPQGDGVFGHGEWGMGHGKEVANAPCPMPQATGRLSRYTHEEMEFPVAFNELLFCPFCFDFEEEAAKYDEGDVSFSIFKQFTCIDRFKIKLSGRLQDNSLIVDFHYDPYQFGAEDIERFLDQFHQLVESAIKNPEAEISELEILSDRTKNQLLVEFNQTEANYPKDKCIHQLIEQQVKLVPNNIAVEFVDAYGAASTRVNEQLTYSQLNSRANQLAHYLQHIGITPGTLVGICIERSLDMIVGILGILKAGGAYVPLDPTYPQERLAGILENSQTPVLLTQRSLLERLPAHQWRVICLDSEWEVIAQQNQENLTTLQITPKNLAYIIYTSGSTGKPKGVQITHRNLVHSTIARISYYQEPIKRFLLLSSFAFDSSVAGIFWTLCCGGTLVLPQEGLQREVAELVKLICHHHITHLLSLPSLYALILQQAKREQLLSLHTIIVAGESCPKDLVNRHQENLPQASLFNEYGPTEGTVWSTVYRCQSQELTRVPIGRPITNTQIYILDSKLCPVPIGVAGEIYISGDGLALGYLNQPELTAQRFISNPFSRESTARLYKTGDLAQYHTDGNIEFLGRIDQQVKIRGFRIELGEIEVVLSQHSEVKEAVVIAREDEPGNQRLVAYIVLTSFLEGKAATAIYRDLRQFLQVQLPDYMIPSAFVQLEAFPLSPNGKVDRQTLPVPEKLISDRTEAFVTPRTPVEEILAGIWAEVLALKQVGVHDNFFELGGHSILATQIVSRIRDTLQVELMLRSLFESPTVAGLAVTIEAVSRNKQGLFTPPLLSIDRNRDLPLSFAQQRMWFFDQLEPENPAYNIPGAIRVQGALNVEALHSSINEIFRRHEILRTKFVVVDGKAVQVIIPELILPLPTVNLRLLSETEQEAETQRLIFEEAQRPFHLAQEPLLRAKLLWLAAEEYILVFTMHHIVSDAWSAGVLVRELTALYEAFSKSLPSSLPELPIQYADFAVWQREWLQGEQLQVQLDYWKQQLRGDLPVLPLPTDRPRPAVQTFAGKHHSLVLPKELSQALKTLSQQEGVTLFMTLLAAFKTLLYRYTEQEDILIGSAIANRNRAEIEHLIGFFVNSLVLRTDLSGNPSFRELLGRVRDCTLSAYAHQDLPFEKLVEELQLRRDTSHPPLFQVMFVFQNAPMETLYLSGLSIEFLQVKSETAKFDLTMTIGDSEQGLAGTVEYNTDLFDQATISRLVGHFETLLTGIVANPEQRLWELPLLRASEQQQMMDWNYTQTDYPKEMCLHQLFEVQVERSPDAVAVVFEDEQLTYRELNVRANQLAHYLRSLGVGPEVLVGICVERSLHMVIGLLAILKAGGAYVPLDPMYPPERLAFMLENADIFILLTEKRLAKRLPEHKGYAICLDADCEAIAQHSQENPVSGVTPDNLIYVIYTSGSTGKPKGAGVYQRSFANLMNWFVTEFDFTCNDRVLLISSLSFDLTQKNIYAPLLVGGELHLLSSGCYDAAQIVESVSNKQVTWLNCTPSAFYPLIDQGDKSLCMKKTLKYVFLGGEPISISSLKVWLDSVPCKTQIVNTYGPTECTDICAAYRVAQPEQWLEKLVPIGKPIHNAKVYVLDENLKPLPVGMVGELYVGGEGVGRGYINNIDLTLAKFVCDPFSNKPGARLYKSGDLARYLADGNIEYLGRIDNQVKIRGFRIELGEIEVAINQYPAVKETVVVVSEESVNSKRLVAYLIPQKQQTLTIPELRSFLESKLPNYMVPAAFVTLEALPLTPNGKVDRKALPAPEQIRPELEKAFIAPQTTVEKQLALIWAQVLGLEKIGINDNFFDLGGDSILSLQIISKANLAGLHLTPKQLFQHQTIAQLATVAGTTKIIQAEQVAITGSLALTPIQHWFFEQQQPEPDHWNQGVLLEVKQSIDRMVLEQVMQSLQRHHDALRLRFLKEEFGTLAVIVSPNDLVPVTYLDLLALPKEEQAAAMEAMAAKLQASLNLSEGPLFRVALFDLGEEQPSRLLWAIHHLAVDGVSWRILFEDFQTAYQQLCQGKEIQLPPKTTSFKQWSHRLQEYAQSSVLHSELEYWLTSKRQSVKPIPVDYPYANNTETTACTVSVSLSVEETQALLQKVPAAYQTQINDILLTALTQTFVQWTGESSLLVDLEGHGREELFEDVDVSRTVGWFTSIFSVHLSLENTFQPGKSLMAIKEQLRAIPNRGISYGLLYYLSRDQEITEQLSLLPKAEVIFNYLGQFDQVLPESSLFSLAQESIGPSHSLRSKRTHLLEINGGISQGRLQMNWTYNEKLHRQTTVERLAQGFIEALRSLITHCQSPDAGGFTPSDFAKFEQSQWSQADLDAITGAIGDV